MVVDRSKKNLYLFISKNFRELPDSLYLTLFSLLIIVIIRALFSVVRKTYYINYLQEFSLESLVKFQLNIHAKKNSNDFVGT